MSSLRLPYNRSRENEADQPSPPPSPAGAPLGGKALTPAELEAQLVKARKWHQLNSKRYSNKCNKFGKAKDVIKSVKKCIGSRSKTTQLFAVMLLEMLLNNCGEPVHRHVIDNGLLPILVKIVKKKTDLPVREKIFLLLDATQTSLGGAKERFPQYYEAYYELVVGLNMQKLGFLNYKRAD
ncbi:ENTH/VHS/GAT family protein [Zea mays]|uniref:ENTH/VHS/GAT family protein n=1 Tax=Zea mays TaxID=4577 RepID=A0A1D6GYR0_MAIZE|nr:ENTH/VHS/GAT family protein [Zea mays]